MPISGLDMAVKYGRSLGDHSATDALIDDISVASKVGHPAQGALPSAG